ncbi:hypothetical protein LX77_02897 [Gelidibacter algens]|uniref:DUF7281 domain-containing protein n=1 Tax=Gelidibacter algens TaxID=49280 RepID=A0A1A7QQD3_9FLAO|nr:hypothetical protein [Gelidibacter algens]OBX21538.1 hypothetical protein A9996_17975 [Gelidibacter algens]RAJ21143.1 hypothetical protein LX77_02897 [Gelidibacter algens]
MKLTPKIARILLRFTQGETLPASAAKSPLVSELIAENILLQKGKHRKTLTLSNEKALLVFLSNQLQIYNLEDYITALDNKESSRADFVNVATDSKTSKERAFKGFLINAYDHINATLNAKDYPISPHNGSFAFIYDYENFRIPEDITIVGVENARNFRHIQEQRYLFKDINPLFISRYPQSQHKDVISWLKTIPNQYLHFGDFDLAGIGIYLNEYKVHLQERSQFFIPSNIQELIHQFGNRQRYNKQIRNFNVEIANEPLLDNLLKIIEMEKKGLDQEYFIQTLKKL